MAKKKRPTVVFASTEKLVVDVDPDLPRAKNWRFKLQVRKGGKWKKVGIYRTRGATELRSLSVGSGRYRVKVYARPGYRSVTTKAYQFVPTTPVPPGTPTPVPSDTTPPGQVTGLAVAGRTATSITLTWVNPTDPDLAAVLVRRAAGATAPASPSDGVGVPLASAMATSAGDTGLVVRAPYSYAVFARDAAGNVGAAASITTSTLAASLQETVRVSVATDGSQADSESVECSVSGDGRWVAFRSAATNLVPNDTNAVPDVFLFDRTTGTTSRVSVGPGGVQADAGSYGRPAISADGRWIAYWSMATNLVPNDTNIQSDVFLYDRVTGATSRVSLGPGGVQADGSSSNPGISADGRWVGFGSWATNLVASDTNGTHDVFLTDTSTGTTRLVSVATDGTQGDGISSDPSLSEDGSWVVYESVATNLVPGDTNAVGDVFLFDRGGGVTMRASVATGGAQGNDESGSPQLSADGRWTTFYSYASNLVAADTNGATDVFVFDAVNKVTTRVARGVGGAEPNGPSGPVGISGDGRWIAFSSGASNLVPGDANGQYDVFVLDMAGGVTSRVSLAAGGNESDVHSYGGRVSADGRWICYESDATNLVGGDTNGMRDVFLSRMW